MRECTTSTIKMTRHRIYKYSPTFIHPHNRSQNTKESHRTKHISPQRLWNISRSRTHKASQHLYILRKFTLASALIVSSSLACSRNSVSHTRTYACKHTHVIHIAVHYFQILFRKLKPNLFPFYRPSVVHSGPIKKNSRRERVAQKTSR